MVYPSLSYNYDSNMSNVLQINLVHHDKEFLSNTYAGNPFKYRRFSASFKHIYALYALTINYHWRIIFLYISSSSKLLGAVYVFCVPRTAVASAQFA